jgi:hypothetical protein
MTSLLCAIPLPRPVAPTVSEKPSYNLAKFDQAAFFIPRSGAALSEITIPAGPKFAKIFFRKSSVFTTLLEFKGCRKFFC